MKYVSRPLQFVLGFNPGIGLVVSLGEFLNNSCQSDKHLTGFKIHSSLCDLKSRVGNL